MQHKRAKMAAYVIGSVEVTDPAAFQEYRNRIGATVEQYGGKFVVRGGRVNPKEGDWQPRHLLMLEFPSFEEAERWYNSPEYKPLIPIREKAARTQLLIAEGT
jgi:uncharacterized protein (DUF1330 family)